MKSLNTITLAIIDCVEPAKAAKVLSHCATIFPVERSILCTHEMLRNSSSNIEIQIIDKLTSVDAYSEFILRRLHLYISTSHCLLIQTDGFIINPSQWNDAFFDYDFIGAPLTDFPVWHSFLPDWYISLLQSNLFGENRWPMNGGFSLRSKKLLELTATCPHESTGLAEDNYINVIHRTWFEEHGATFPSRVLAFSFSHENPIIGHQFHFNDCFGFHGKISPKHKELANIPFQQNPTFLTQLFNLIPTVSIADFFALKIKNTFNFTLSTRDFKTLSCINKTYNDTVKGSIELFIYVEDCDVEKLSQTLAYAKDNIKHSIATIFVLGKTNDDIAHFCNKHFITFLENESEEAILNKEHKAGFCIIRSGTIIIKAISFFTDTKSYVFFANTTNHFEVGIMYFDGVLLEKWKELDQKYTNLTIEQCFLNYINWQLLQTKKPNYRYCKYEKRKWLGDASFWVALYEPSDFTVIRFED